MRTATVRLGRAKQDRVIGVSLDVLLQILRALESLSTKVALVRLQWHVNTDVRCDVIALYSGSTAISPLASQVQVVGTFATNMALTNVVLVDI